MLAPRVARLVQWLMLLWLCVQETSGALAKARSPKKGKAKPAKGPVARGFGGGGFGGGTAPKALPSLGDAGLDAALADRCAALRKAPNSAEVWLQIGSLLVKGQEYAEAERAFRVGAHRAPGNEMLSGAALSLGGDSAAYCRGGAVATTPPPVDLSDANFDCFQAPAQEVLQRDQSDRAVDWTACSAEIEERGVVFRSRTPLLDPSDCAWVIKEVEAQAARTGWTTDRHVQAPTTDIPVSQVDAIREWFDEQLRSTLLPSAWAPLALLSLVPQLRCVRPTLTPAACHSGGQPSCQSGGSVWVSLVSGPVWCLGQSGGQLS